MLLPINVLQPDYMGMILSAGFRRSVPLSTAKQLVRQKSATVQAVGVFVDETAETILQVTEQLHLNVIQLHGTESPELLTQLQTQTGLPVWKAVRIRNEKDLQAVADMQADNVILEGDTKMLLVEREFVQTGHCLRNETGIDPSF